MDLRVQSHKLVHVCGVHFHMCVSSTSGCSIVCLTVQYCIEYSCTVSICQAQDVSEVVVCSPSPIADDPVPSALPSPMSSPSSSQ